MSTPAAASGTRRTPTERPEELDRTDPDRHVAEAAEAFRNWGRWGNDDRLGTLNFINDAARARAAALVHRGASFSLSQPFDMNGPQQGWRRRTNPVHTMLDTGTDAAAGWMLIAHPLPRQPARSARRGPRSRRPSRRRRAASGRARCRFPRDCP